MTTRPLVGIRGLIALQDNAGDVIAGQARAPAEAIETVTGEVDGRAA